MSHFVSTEIHSAIINLPARIHHTVHVMFPATSMKLTAVQVHTNPWCAMMEVQSSLTKYTIPLLFPVMAMAWLWALISYGQTLRKCSFHPSFWNRCARIGSNTLCENRWFATCLCKKIGSLKPLCSSPFPEHVCSLWNSSILWRNSSGGNGHPPDFYGRPLKEFWFKYTKPPSDKMEATFLEFVEQLVSNQPELRKRLMSPFSVHNATAISPFLLSLNALLVVTGFCHVFTRHCQDKLLLGLQEVAKENKMGPIWCGASQNFIHGWKSDNSGDYILKHFILETTMNLERKGYPYQKSNAFLPWHERKMTKQICSNQTTRAQARDHLAQHLPGKEPQFGIYEITR